MSDGGKGDSYRPYNIDKFNSNWDLIFRKEDKCEFCGKFHGVEPCPNQTIILSVQDINISHTTES